jgi:hypothetical protein
MSVHVVGKYEGKRPLERSRCTQYNNILLRVSWEASLLGGSLLGDSFVNTQQYCRRC